MARHYQQLDELVGQKEQVLADGALSEQRNQERLGLLALEMEQVEEQLHLLGDSVT